MEVVPGGGAKGTAGGCAEMQWFWVRGVWCWHKLVYGTCPAELRFVQAENAGAAVGHGLGRADCKRKLDAKVARLPHGLGAVGARHLQRRETERLNHRTRGTAETSGPRGLPEGRVGTAYHYQRAS